MEMRQLEYFLEAVHCHSVRAAARTLQVTEPTMLRQLNLLEDELGLQLLTRTRRGVDLTTVGQSLLPDIEGLVEQQHQIFTRVRELRNFARVISIGVIPSLSAWFYGRVLRQTPQTEQECRFEISESGSLTILLQIAQRALDLGLVVIPADDDSFKSAYPNLTFEIIATGALVVAVAAHGKFQSKDAVTLTDIATEPLVIFRDGYLAHRLIKDGIVPRNSPAIDIYADNGHLATDIIKADQGISFAASFSHRDTNGQMTDIRLLPIRGVSRPIHLALTFIASSLMKGPLKSIRRGLYASINDLH